MPKVSDEHLAARRRQILDAAAACFARDGFHRTSMQDVVRESGVSAGLVYRYFTGKDDMIAAIVGEWHDQRRVFDDPDAGLQQRTAAYLELLRGLGDPAARPAVRLSVQVWAEAARRPELRALSRTNVDDPRAGTAALLGGLPLAPGIDPDALARILIAVQQGLTLQTAWDETVDHDAVASTMAAVLDALLR
ncbi:MAG: TetR/AcrR family transcriptional regulator [Actinoplanes sp.]